jgi:RNA polymerase sigma factor (sigma-70 family)
MFNCDCPPDDCAGRVEAYLRGDRSAGDALATKFAPLVRAIVARVLGAGRREEWDDACQTIFLRLFSNIGQWGQKCPFCKWLAVVAARRSIDLGRLATPPQQMELEQVPDTRPAPPGPETMECIERTVARFPEEWRRVWEGYLAGEKREEIARRLSRSLRTIQYWLAEMLDQVREALGE